MLLKKFKLALFVALLLSMCTISHASKSCRITDIRFWQSPEEAQVVLDISNEPRVSSVNKLRNGTLYFDISNCSFKPGRQRYPMKNPFLDVLTVQEKGRGVVRVFFRVPKGVEAKTFVLPKNQKKTDRIVIFLKEPEAKVAERRTIQLKEVQKLKSRNIHIVVLDPGHGGEDPGCRNNGITEKRFVMTMGKLVKAYFDRDPRFKAILTRKGDYIIPLEKRREMAERLGADAFVSLHANSNRKKAIRGFEVYYESPHGAVGEAERLVAKAENQVDFSGAFAKKKAQKFSKLTKRKIMKKQAAMMFQSRQLANKVERRLRTSVKNLASRGVKRAGFRVLHSMNMPSILVEYGYTSNYYDSKILKNYTSKTKLARATYLGIRDFLLGNIETGIDSSYYEYIKRQEKLKKRKIRNRRRAKIRLKKARRRAKKYKVRRGDCLSTIAKKFRTKMSTIRYLNQFSRKHKLKAGVKIYVPRR